MVSGSSRQVAVVVVAYNSAEVVGELLHSLPGGDPGRRFPIIVVDNGSRDGTRELLSARPDVQLLEQSNTGYAHAVNRALAAVPERHDVLVLNPDIVVGPRAIARLVDILERYPDVGVVVPAIRDGAGSLAPSLRRDPSVPRVLAEAVLGGRHAGRLGERWTPAPAGLQDTAWATGAAMLLRWETIAALGELSEAYFMYSEETEYCLRARDAGWRVACEPSAEMTHIGGDMASNGDLWALRAVNRVRLYHRRYGRIRAEAIRIASLLFEIRRALSGSHVSRAAIRALLRPDLDKAAVRLVLAVGGDPAPLRDGPGPP